jgi:nucleoside-diphosphate-sugar epimerase
MDDFARAQATVFGANGFVGRALLQHLTAEGYAVRAVTRGDDTWRDADLGHAFYTVGLTADFRSRPFETIDAHVSLLTRVLRAARFRSFVYLSSTRVYATAGTTNEETAIPVSPGNPDHLYNISKLMGESACLGSGLANVRVARLSNVFGRDLASENFLTAVLREAATETRVSLRTGLASEKDYVWVGDGGGDPRRAGRADNRFSGDRDKNTGPARGRSADVAVVDAGRTRRLLSQLRLLGRVSSCRLARAG